MGGADRNAIGLNYSSRLSNIAPGQHASWTVEDMQGVARIEGVGVLLPDGQVFLCSGAGQGGSLYLPKPQKNACLHMAWEATGPCASPRRGYI